jgi:hypothetical protein
MTSTISWDIASLPPACLLLLLNLFFDPENGGDIFLRKIG